MNKLKGEECVFYKHGFSIRDKTNRQPQLYMAWVNMRQRCKNPNRPDYSYYGGRGISYDPRWEKFENFYADMGHSFEEHRRSHSTTTLERIDVDGPYSLRNCRWATRKEQSNNRKFNRLISYKGKSQTAYEWAEELPIKIEGKDLYRRVFGRNWPIEKAMTQPPRTFH